MKLVEIALFLLSLSSRVPKSKAGACDLTSLEIAINKAFNALVEDGTYADIFDGLSNIQAGSFCSGKADQWPTPKAEKDSDLKRVLRNNKFVCGYNADNTYLTSSGDLLLDTTRGKANGPLVAWWKEIGKKLGDLYGRKMIDVEWDISFRNSQETLDAVQSGRVDAACARWGQDGFWTNAEGVSVPRSLALSSQHCVTYLEEQQIYTLKESDIASFSDLIDFIDRGIVTSVCTVGSTGGGTTQSCNSILAQYTKMDILCSGEATEAFPKLQNGSCDAVWGGGPNPEDLKNFYSFAQPTIYVAGSFFRRQDLSSNKSDLTPPLRR